MYLFEKKSSVVFGFSVYNEKKEVSKLLKWISGFKSTEKKVFSYVWLKFKKLKENTKKKSHVNDTKRKNVANLMKFFTIALEANSFYENILKTTIQNENYKSTLDKFYNEDDQQH